MSDDNETPMPMEDYDLTFGIKRDAKGRFPKGTSGNPAGKPKGTVSITSKASVKKLEELGLDPIEHLHGLYENALAEGDDELAFKILNRLLDFGYSRQPTLSEVKTEEVGTFSITTTKKEKDDG